MKCKFEKHIATLFFLAFTFFNAGYISADQLQSEVRTFHHKITKAKPAYSAIQARSYADELIPLIENATGKRFKRVPKIRLVSTEELNDILIRDLITKIKKKKKTWEKERISKKAIDQAKSLSLCQLGMYLPQDKTLYLLPERIDPLLYLLKVDKCHREKIIKLHITHELTHALQDQYMDLEKRILETINSSDALEALMCVIEGHAVFIQEKVGKKLKFSEDLIQAYLDKAVGLILFKDPIMQMRNRFGMTKMEIRYLRGKDFIDYHYNIGQNDKIWQILSNPPRDTSIIMNPAEYITPTKSNENQSLTMANLLDGFEVYFDTGKTVIDNFEMPKTELNLLAFQDKEMRKEVISKINKIQVLTINRGLDYMGGIMACQLNDESYGEKLISLFEDLDRKVDKILNKNIENYANRIVTKAYKGIQADYAYQQKELNRKGKILNSKYALLYKQLLIRIVSFDCGEGTISKDNLHNIYSSIISRYNRILNCPRNDSGNPNCPDGN